MLSTLKTIFRASSAEAEEALLDANAARLMAQHLRDARHDLARGRGTLASLVALEKQEGAAVQEAQTEIDRREKEAMDAFGAGQESIAAELSERILDLEDRRSRAVEAQTELGGRIQKLRDQLRQVEARISRLTEELRLAKARGASHSAVSTAPMRADALAEAEAMGQRLREQSLNSERRIEAMSDPRLNTSSDLDSRLREAGIGDQRTTRRDALRARLSATAKPST